jgi:hypothetical protein
MGREASVRPSLGRISTEAAAAATQMESMIMATDNLRQTPLELGILTFLYKLYGHQGFPPPEAIRVLSKKNTGGGRYVALGCWDVLKLGDGDLDMVGQYISMKSLPNVA